MSPLPCAPRGQLTVEDYLLTPAGPPWHELIEGQLWLEPSPSAGRQSILRELVGALALYLKASPLGILFFAPLDVYLNATNVFQPDVLVVMNSRRQIITPRGVPGAPDFVVEILCPSNHQVDRGPKRRRYAQAGVRELWIVDPREKTIESFLLGENSSRPARIWRPGDILSSARFPGLAIPLDEVFSGALPDELPPPEGAERR